MGEPTLAELLASRMPYGPPAATQSLAPSPPPVPADAGSMYNYAPPAGPVTPALVAQQSVDPAAPGYVNPASPYYRAPAAAGGALLGRGPSAAPAPPAPADPNKFAQQSTDPSAPYYVNPASPFFNPKAPKPVDTGWRAPMLDEADVAAMAKQAPAAPTAPAPVTTSNRYAGGSSASGPAAPSPVAGVNWNDAGGTRTVAAHEMPVVSTARQGELDAALGAESTAVEGQKDAVKGSAAALGEVERQKSIGEHDVAKAAEDAGVDTKLRADIAKDESKAFRKHIDDFSAKVAKEKIDPNRMWNDASTGQKVTWTIAKMFGAFGQAFLHTSTNQVADHIENMAAQDVAAQRANHEMNRERVGDMNSMYAQALHATGTAEDAERVATGYALEAAKHNALALTQAATTDVQKAKGEELAAALSERQALIGQKKVETDIKMNPLVQARTVSAGPDMAKVYATARQYTEEQAKLGTVVAPDDAIRWAYKMHTGADPTPGRGSFVQGAKLEGGNKELHDTQIATDEFNKQMATLSNHPVITGSGLSDAALANLPQRLAPKSNDSQQQLEAINTQILQAIGKVAKDADGKPNKAMIEKIEHRFEIHLSDSPEIKQQKLNGVRDVYNALARQQGANAPEPAKGGPPGFQQ